MLRALKFAIKMTPDRDPRELTRLVRLMDLVLRDFEIYPVIWDCQMMAGNRLRWMGYIPHDCKTTFDIASEYLVALIQDHAKSKGAFIRFSENPNYPRAG